MDSVKSVDILIVGGGPAGMVVATTAKSYYPDKSVLLVRKNRDALVPCAIPYVFGESIGDCKKNLIPHTKITESGVELEFDEVIDIDFDAKKAKSALGATYIYDKLVFATGSEPNLPCAVKGAHLSGVYSVPKVREEIEELKKEVDDKKSAVIVGTGFIGIEVAVELADRGKSVTLIGESGRVLHTALDEEFSSEAEEILEQKGIRVIKNAKLLEISCESSDKKSVILENGERIDADFVILGIGYHPQTELAKKLGLRLGKKGGIWVDEYMRTEIKDVFAVGDCASKQHFITRKTTGVMLASTSTAEARICAASLYNIEYIRGFSGTIAIFSTMIGDRAFASAGITEEEARVENMDVVTGYFEGMDKHPACLAGCQSQKIKLVATRRGGVVVGGQASGGVSVGEMINVIGLIIENKMNVYSLLHLQVATHPLLTAAPTAYPIVKAAEALEKKIFDFKK